MVLGRVRYLVRMVAEREHWVREHLEQRIPGLEIIWDKTRFARDTMMAALETAGADPAVHLEDDVVLTTNFTAKIEAAIAERPKRVIQFFSLRKNDLELGSRAMPGRSFLMAQCFYLPAGLGLMLRAYEPIWVKRLELRPALSSYPGTQDAMIRDWMAARRETYWLHVPSLVQHRPIPSAIHPRRPRGRQSPSFRL